VPFDLKYQDTAIGPKKLKGLCLFLEQKDLQYGYAITRRWDDFRVLDAWSGESERKMLAIPAPLACYWLSS